MAAPVGSAIIVTCWAVMLVGIYATLFGLLRLVFGDLSFGLPITIVGFAALALMVWQVKRMYR